MTGSRLNILPSEASPEPPPEPSFEGREGTRALMIVLPYLVGKNEATKAKMRSYLAFPYGVLSIASYVNEQSRVPVEIDILDLNLVPNDEIEGVFAEHLERFAPDVIGLSMMFDNCYPHVATLTKQAKAHNASTVVVLGGSAATTSWGEIIAEQEHLDAVCYSDGELALLTLIESEDRLEALNRDPWVTRESLAAERSPTTQYVEDLDEVINIDYELVDVMAYSMKEAFSPFASYRNEADVRQFYLVTSRGCPFKCVFCAEPSLQGAAMRYSSVDAIITHVRGLVDRYGMNVLTIYDDQLLLHQERAKELFRRLAEFNLRIETPNGVTLHYIDEEMATLMNKAGVDTIPLAIESGSDHVLNRVIKKPLKADRIKPVVNSLQDNNIFVQAFFVIGLPGEFDEHRLETMQVIMENDIDWSGFSLATPLRGTELYKICIDNGYIKEGLGIGDVGDKVYIINAPEIGLEPERITRQAYLMNLEVNFVNNRRMRIGDYKVAAECFQEVIERYHKHAFAHYFLAEALEKIGGREDEAAENRRQFEELVALDSDWRDYADFFGLIEPSEEAMNVKSRLTRMFGAPVARAS